MTKDAYYMTHVYGLFHSNERIRKRCASFLATKKPAGTTGLPTLHCNPWSSVAERQRTRRGTMAEWAMATTVRLMS